MMEGRQGLLQRWLASKSTLTLSLTRLQNTFWPMTRVAALPADVRAGYETEVADYLRYSQHIHAVEGTAHSKGVEEGESKAMLAVAIKMFQKNGTYTPDIMDFTGVTEIQEGIEEGKYKAMLAVAIRMFKKNGTYTPDIVDLTGVTEARVREALAKEKGQEDVGLLQHYFEDKDIKLFGYGVRGYDQFKLAFKLAKDLGVGIAAALFGEEVHAESSLPKAPKDLTDEELGQCLLEGRKKIDAGYKQLKSHEPVFKETETGDKTVDFPGAQSLVGHDQNESCTLYPELRLAEDIALWDCPGFRDTRGFFVIGLGIVLIMFMLQLTARNFATMG
eukprot:gene15994-16164_t